MAVVSGDVAGVLRPDSEQTNAIQRASALTWVKRATVSS
jgi:hypothetical protein